MTVIWRSFDCQFIEMKNITNFPYAAGDGTPTNQFGHMCIILSRNFRLTVKIDEIQLTDALFLFYGDRREKNASLTNRT